MVRHINLPAQRGRLLVVYPAIHPSALMEVCQLRAARPLIPHLRTLSVDDACDYATLFLAETLECVRIVRAHNTDGTFGQSDDPPRPWVWNLLALLQTRAPFVEELYVGSPPSSANLADILRLKHLRKLTLNISKSSWPDEKARYRFLKDLECLPKLQVLNIGRLLEDRRPLRSATGYTFPALESLTFQGFDMVSLVDDSECIV